MDRLRSNPPSIIAGAQVVEKRDIQTSKCTDVLNATTTTLTLPVSNVLSFFLEDGTRIVVRPSGTEPKIKFYFETQTTIDSINDWEKSHSINQNRITELIDDLVHKTLGIE